MAIELICKGCSRKLRVADENAGKVARCPSCGETFTVPSGPGAISTPLEPAFGSGAFAPTQPPAAMASDRWMLRNPDGTTYGPASKAELDAWAAEGRVTAAAQIKREEDAAWQPAHLYYPALASGAGSSPFGAAAAGKNPYSDAAPTPFPNPYASPAPVPGQTYGRTGMINGRYVQPHRGGTILTLGILGLCLCQFLGIAAIVMASQDLKLMNEGRMDASGKGMTIAGLVLGIISIVLIGLNILLAVAGGLN